MDEVKSRFLCEMEADLEMHPIGETPTGTRLVAAVTGGRVTGERLRGRVLPFGGDFALFGADGCLHIDVRAGFELEDGARIYATYGGRLVLTAEQSAALADPAQRAALDPADYYFRTAPLFQSGDPRYAWLDGILAVGIGRLTASGVAYRIFEIL
ncbi:MAG TPA: DUF3237 domain-containing protein [Pseudomonadales bacterium]|nr:DUF3237 domain-containing protein [Pseudomonadales bacterium]